MGLMVLLVSSFLHCRSVVVLYLVLAFEGRLVDEAH